MSFHTMLNIIIIVITSEVTLEFRLSWCYRSWNRSYVAVVCIMPTIQLTAN